MIKFNGQSYELKYLFRAMMADGTLYEQTTEDISITNPEKSAFFDILDKPIKSFWLEGQNLDHAGVNLETGCFNINGLEIKLHEEPLSDFRLIYFRRHRHHFNPADGKEIGHEMEYHFGWQTTEDGKNIQKTIIIK